ncbi:MAG: hypothetical protein J5674_02270, partial [Candidatus Methanomethylophilaceae archaeon]|nr:hypothetical protein [Candidatus Methanomethylophilaceae archaeon]
MASEIFDIALKGDGQRTVRKGKVPAGSTFADLERYVLRSMGWDSDGLRGFVVPGTGARIGDESTPVDTYGRMPLDYVRGKTVLRITFLGLSDPDYSSSAFEPRRSSARTEAIRDCLRRREKSLSSTVCLDDATLRKVADAIASSRKADMYLDLETMSITSNSGARTVLIREKESSFLIDAEKRFCASAGIDVRAQESQWHARFLQEVSRSSKTSKAWQAFLEKESVLAAEAWAVENGLRGNAHVEDPGLLPCRYCGKDLEASEDLSGMPVMADRPRYPMIVRCPECGKASRLRLFNDGFSLEYCFEGESRSCHVTKGLTLARKQAESETDPDKKAYVLLIAALEAYRCGKQEDSRRFLEEASRTKPEESAAVSAYICSGKSYVYDGDCLLAKILSDCSCMLSEDSFDLVSKKIESIEDAVGGAGLPYWLVWDIRLSEILALSSTEDAEKAFESMEKTVRSFIYELDKKGFATGEDCRVLCSMTEAVSRFSHLRLGPEKALPLLDYVSELFSKKPFHNPAVLAVVGLRRGAARMSLCEDDGAVTDLISVIDSVNTISGRGPVAGRRALAA